ncbi:MAG: patatin-like phospholipase family protein [Gammaproteobacteria bacterium]|nr:MAG: patatin-like phospholipase family protein [Gammaproteobacteria bacterium]
MGKKKVINLALQGGGAHGAFGWGVLDKLLEDGRVDIEGVCGTSAGSMNAVVYAYGKMRGGVDRAREDLERFWKQISQFGNKLSPVQKMPWEAFSDNANMDNSLMFNVFESFIRVMSPYQFNPFNFHPLKVILQDSIDFEELHACKCSKLFISATNVRTGKVKVFINEEITMDVVLASACLPFLFQAIEINGENYWDGGYMGNPALFPLFYHTDSRDVVVVHINPIERNELPKKPNEIFNRVNEITFNSSLLKELRAIAFVNKMLDQGWIKDEFKDRLKHMLVHSIRADKAMCDLSVASKFATDWKFLKKLRDRGRKVAQLWLDENYASLNKESTVDLYCEFLDIGSEHIG